MDVLKDFLRDKSPAQIVMLVAILLLFASQFFLYLNDESTGMLVNMTNTDLYTGFIPISPGAIGTGWELHPHAYVILVVLAFAFLRDDILNAGWFSRFGWWIGLVLVIAATVPGAYLRDAPGGTMGGISVLIALGAVILHIREARLRAKPQLPEAGAQKP